MSDDYTKYEKARIIGSRALQIAMGAPVLIKLTDEQIKAMGFNPIKMAVEEFNEGVIPITVKRPHPGGKVVLKKSDD
jgi:DNA-directed RNA polymerase subunit K